MVWSWRDRRRAIQYLDKPLLRDMAYLVLGDYLGSGVARMTFVLRSDPTLVMKVETEAQSYQNIMEWDLWIDNKGDPAVARWLAPCVDISGDGAFLIQRRTAALGPTERMPVRVPDFLHDLKRENFGKMDGRVVCHDYGLVGKKLSTRMVKADFDERSGAFDGDLRKKKKRRR